MSLIDKDLKLLREVAAYFSVWVDWSQDPKLIERASHFRRADSAEHSKRFQNLKMRGYISNQGSPIAGGGVAFPLTSKGKRAIES